MLLSPLFFLFIALNSFVKLLKYLITCKHMHNFTSNILFFSPVDVVLKADMRRVRDNATEADRE